MAWVLLGADAVAGAATLDVTASTTGKIETLIVTHFDEAAMIYDALLRLQVFLNHLLPITRGNLPCPVGQVPLLLLHVVVVVTVSQVAEARHLQMLV